MQRRAVVSTSFNGYISPLAAAESSENDGSQQDLKSFFLSSESRIVPEPPQLIVFVMISCTESIWHWEPTGFELRILYSWNLRVTARPRQLVTHRGSSTY